MTSPSGDLRDIPLKQIQEIAPICHVRGDQGYENARAVWNGTVKTEPAAIVSPESAKAVAEIVSFAADNNLSLGVKGGGHNVAGTALVQDGLTIALERMRGIDVDEKERVAHVQGGVTLGELDAATQEVGLAVPSGFVSKTGIAGLALRGGLGHLMRRFGLSCDNLLGAEVVTPDGELRRASESENPDLLWALRGGCVNVGVVTRFDFRLHDLGPEVTLVMPIYSAERGRDLLEFMQRYISTAPNELGLIAFYGHLPEDEELPEAVRDQEVFVFFGCYSGPESSSEEITAPIRTQEGLLADLSEQLPYTELQQVLDPDYPDGMRYYWRSLYLDDLTGQMLDKIHQYGMNRPSAESTLDLWTLGGAIDALSPESTAFRQRGSRFMLAVEANWESPPTDQAAREWAREVSSALESDASRGAYMNFAGSKNESGSLLQATYGPNLSRLKEIKERYDPQNLFG